MPRWAAEYLKHILVEADYLSQASAATNKDLFLSDETLKRSFVRSIEVIGEAIKQVPDSIRASNRAVEWRMIAAMRDKLIHGYFGVDYEIVWDVATTKVPDLSLQIRRILESETS